MVVVYVMELFKNKADRFVGGGVGNLICVRVCVCVTSDGVVTHLQDVRSCQFLSYNGLICRTCYCHPTST